MTHSIPSLCQPYQLDFFEDTKLPEQPKAPNPFDKKKHQNFDENLFKIEKKDKDEL